jgi:BASS family bile acid:Na+ symporter
MIIMIELAIPVLVFFLMFIIGASLEKDELKNIRHIKKQVLAVTLGQMLLLPFCAWLIIQVMQPPSLVAGGMLLVSLCPGGAVSNIYSFLAKANVALSVTLTAFNGLVSILVLPLVMLIVFPSLLGVDLPLENIIFKQGLQLMLLLFFPVVIGMSLRQIKPQLTCKMMPTFEKIGAIGLLLLLISIFIKYHQKIVEQLSSLLVLALIFTLASLLIAYCLSCFLKLARKDEAAVVIEFPVRNLALAALLAVSIFENSDYLLFAAVFFVIQTPIMLIIIAVYRSSFFNADTSLKTTSTT